MKEKAVISTGGKQYIVATGDELEVEFLGNDTKKITFDTLMLIDGSKSKIGSPNVGDSKVSAEIVGETKSDKTSSIRYKAKKRVHKVKGHRQKLSKIKITSIK